jgi:hypothetical protein
MTRLLFLLSCLGLVACGTPVPTPHTPPPFARWTQVPGPDATRPAFVRCIEPGCPAPTPKTESPEVPADTQIRPPARAPP